MWSCNVKRLLPQNAFVVVDAENLPFFYFIKCRDMKTSPEVAVESLSFLTVILI
jgi:hypothetical protein